MPDWRSEIVRRLHGARLRGSEADVVEELSHHLEDRYAELRASGLTESAAYARALEELDEGDALSARLRGVKRDAPAPVPIGAVRGAGFIGSVVSDVRYAVRVLWRSPVFTIVAALVIALGIGANTAIFSLLNAILLTPLQGVDDPSTLATVYTSDYSGPRFGASSYPDYESIVEAGVFEDAVIYRPLALSLGLDERGERVIGEVASANLFDMLGVRPLLGRFFGPDEYGGPGTSAVAVIGHDLWQREFGAASDVIGVSLRINGHMHTIIGVAPSSFRGVTNGGVRMDVWLPMSATAQVTRIDPTQRGSRGMFIMGRIPEGVTSEAVQSRLDAVAARLHEEYPGTWTDLNNRSRVLTALSESESRVLPQLRTAVLGIFGVLVVVVGIVLLIACTNVANLMLSRAMSRRSEMGLRLALGATRGRIVRQLLAESVLVASIGGVLGVLFAFWMANAVNTITLPVPIPVSLDIAPDARVLGFAATITLLTGLLFGLLPALHASRSPAPLIKGGDAARGHRNTVRNTLVIVQVAASIVLLSGAGLFLRSLLAARSIDTGIADVNVVLVPLDLGTEGYTFESARQFYTTLLERVSGRPGVENVTLASFVPFSQSWGRRSIVVDGYSPGEGEDMEILFNSVGAKYFETAGIRLVRGRDFTDADRDGAPGVIVVNEAFARRFWPDRDAIGQRVSLSGGEGPFAEVVGIAPDAKYRSLTEEPTPFMYYPYMQSGGSLSMTLHVRTTSDPAPFIPVVRDEISALAPGMPVPDITTLRQQAGMATILQRMAGIVLTVLGGLAVSIATIGLYGVIAYTAAQRTREFGIRTALGAAAGDVQRMVLIQGLRLAAIGAVVGLVASVVLARMIRSMLLVSPADPVALLTVVAVLIGAALLATWIPARRATRADPLVALRADGMS